MSHEFESDWPVPDEIMLELGRLSTLWGSLESGMLVAISKLAGYDDTLDRRAITLTAHASTQQRIDMISTLCEQLMGDFKHLETYPQVVEKLRAAQRARNLFAHNSVTLDAESNRLLVGTVSARGKLKTNVREVNKEEIVEASRAVQRASRSLMSLILGKELDDERGQES